MEVSVFPLKHLSRTLYRGSENGPPCFFSSIFCLFETLPFHPTRSIRHGFSEPSALKSKAIDRGVGPPRPGALPDGGEAEAPGGNSKGEEKNARSDRFFPHSPVFFFFLFFFRGGVNVVCFFVFFGGGSHFSGLVVRVSFFSDLSTGDHLLWF